MRKPIHKYRLSERQVNRLTRPLLRQIKKLEHCRGEECGCLTVCATILERLDLIERLVEVIAMEIKRQGEMKQQTTMPISTDSNS